LSEHRPILDRLSTALLEQESIDGKQVYRLIEDMTGQDLTPARPALPGESMDITPEGPQPALSAGIEQGAGPAGGEAAEEDEAAAAPAASEAEEGEREVAAAQRRSARTVGTGGGK
jgi:hypothetical protein